MFNYNYIDTRRLFTGGTQTHRHALDFIYIYRLQRNQGNRRDMRKIHVTRQHFETSRPQRQLFEKISHKKIFLPMENM